MNLPADFIRNVTHGFPGGGQWLESLPDRLTAAARRWELTLGETFLLSYNYVCAAARKDGTPAVLKLGVPNVELTSEINALRLYDGKGACRLYEADADAGMLLLERLLPGEMLVTLEDDDRATGIAADVMGAIQRPPPPADGFLTLRGWFDDLKGLRSRFAGGTGPFPERTVEIVEGLLGELFAEQRPEVLLHGDFHHYNILSSARGWMVIDPKGVIGAPEYEAGPLLVNPIGDIPERRKAIRRTQRRMAILCERLGFDPQRLWRWAVCFSLLSAWWDVMEDGSPGQSSPLWTGIILDARP